MFIETHCHLDYLKALPLDEIRAKIKAAGITKLITIGVDPLNLDKVRDLSVAHEEIYYTQGIHPHDAKEATAVEFQKIIDRSIEKKMVAVGEIRHQKEATRVTALVRIGVEALPYPTELTAASREAGPAALPGHRVKCLRG